MQTRRTSLVVAASASMLLLTSATAWAQTEPCTGSIEFSNNPADASQDWQATDARLSGVATKTGDWSLYQAAPEDIDNLDPNAAPATFQIVNEDGTWRCVTSTAAGPEPDVQGHSLVFEGLDGYEGLTAHVTVDWNAYPYEFSGVITGDGAPEDPTLAG